MVNLKFYYAALRKFGFANERNLTGDEIQEVKDAMSRGVNYPPDVDLNGNKYVRIMDDLDDKTFRRMFAIKVLELLSTIKSCVVFFTVITVIGILVYLFLIFGRI